MTRATGRGLRRVAARSFRASRRGSRVFRLPPCALRLNTGLGFKRYAHVRHVLPARRTDCHHVGRCAARLNAALLKYKDRKAERRLGVLLRFIAPTRSTRS